MLGAIIGDVAGSVYEFDNTRDYHFKFFSPDSDITDDTVMTMAVAEWAMACVRRGDDTFPLEILERCMVDAARDYPHPKGGYGHAFHNWLFHPERLRDYQTGKIAHKRVPYHSYGNGSAMRVSSIGWLFDTLEETERVAGISASITHDHPEGIKGARAVAAAIFLARTGADKSAIRQTIEARYGYDLADSWERLHREYDWDSSCQGTVPPALVAFLESEGFEDAIRRVVSIGGDSDTLACITGSIAEAYYREIPAFMVEAVLPLLSDKFKKILKDLGDWAYASCYERYVSPLATPCPRRFTPERISTLEPGEVFVFGSNLAGYHGGGAARVAYERFGAEWGVGVGMTGHCYAIPTMQGGVETIRPYVDEFIAYAREHPEYTFLVTRIGCGIAGFTDEQIAPLFAPAVDVSNVILPESFYELLRKG